MKLEILKLKPLKLFPISSIVKKVKGHQLPAHLRLSKASLPAEKDLIISPEQETFEPLPKDLSQVWEILNSYRLLLDYPPDLGTRFCNKQRAIARRYADILFKKKYHELFFYHALNSPRIWIRFIALEMIGMMALHEADAQKLGEDGAVEIVMDVMEMYPYDPYVQLHGLKTLLRLMTSKMNMDRFVLGDGIELVVRTLDTHMYDEGPLGSAITETSTAIFDLLAKFPKYYDIMEDSAY
jgi:hypothetical protein